jgi:hypothetical protein
MLNEFLRLLSRAYTSISVDLLAYVIVPASLFLTASALHPEELEDRISFLSKKKNINLPFTGECNGKIGMEVGNLKLLFLKLERTYWSEKCGSLVISRNLIDIGLRYDERSLQAVGLITSALIIPDVKQAPVNVARLFREATAEDMTIFENGKCQWRIRRQRDDLTFGLVCPRSRRTSKAT